MKKFTLILVCFLIVLSGVGIVSATIITGSLGADSNAGINKFVGPTYTSDTPPMAIRINDVQSTGGMFSFAMFNINVTGQNTPIIFASGPPPLTWAGDTTPITLSYGGLTRATGIIGVQRLFTGATPPVEYAGYFWMSFDNWTPGTLTGDMDWSLSYNATKLYNPVPTNGNGSSIEVTAPPGYFNLVSYSYGLGQTAGDYYYIKQESCHADYTVTSPAGVGINGSINKLGTSSRAYVVNSVTRTVLANEGSQSNTYFNFSVLQQPIYIAVMSPTMIWYNSSVFFGPAIPTPTPAPTIPSGYIVTYFRTFDPLGNSDIHGADISLYDVEAATWTNYTADADGRGEIYTLPYHTVNAIGHYPTAGIYNDGILTGAETGYYGNSGNLYYLDMYPYTLAPPAGWTDLYTTVREADDKSPVFRASIGITNVATGAYYGTNSGSTGVSVDTFPNNTALRIVVSKSGYQTATVVTNTGTGATKYVYVDLTRSTVTPVVTATPLPGEITVRPTYSPGCDPSAYDAAICSGGKDSDMMNQVRDAGPGLIGLAIIATMLGLIKLMMKK